jgi:methionine-rich copper-binding protein CopC
LRGVLIASLLTLGTCPDLAAHALLLESIPKAEASVPAPPQIVLKFNSRIEARMSSVLLVGGPRNTRVFLLMPEAPAADTLVYSLPELAPGQYRAEWKVLSVDGHVNEGVVRFTVIEKRR